MALLQSRALTLAVSAAWVGFLLYLGAVPGLPEELSSTRLAVSTPLGHYGSHVMLGALLYLSFSTPGLGLSHCGRAVILAVLATIAIGAGIEGVQLFIPSRASEAADIVANSLGGATGAALLFTADRLSVGRAILASATAALAVGGILAVGVAAIALKPAPPHVIDCEAQSLESLTSNGQPSASGTLAPVAVAEDDFAGPRVTHGLILLYEFSEGSGPIVHDRSGVEPRVDLRIPDDSKTRWLTESNGIVFRDGVVRSSQRADKVYRALLGTDQLTVEAWVSSNDPSQTGPAKILALGGMGSSRYPNLWLGQEGPKLSFGLRTMCDALKVTQVSGVFAGRAQTHVAVTYDGSLIRTFVNGAGHGEGEPLQGDFSNWNIRYPLTVANDLSENRPFVGTVSLLAIYDRRLSAEEVRRNYLAGAGAEGTTP